MSRAIRSIRRLCSTEPAKAATKPTQELPPNQGGFKFRYVLLAASPFAGYFYYDYTIKQQVLEQADELISTYHKEVREIAHRAHLSPALIRKVYRKNESSIDEQVRPDAFGIALKVMADADAAACHAQDREKQPLPFSSLESVDVLSFVRNSETVTSGKVLLKDCLAALPLMMDPEEEPALRLELAWESFAHIEAPLPFEAFADLMGCLERTGHFEKESLIRKTQWFEPEYSMLTGIGIAELIFDELNLNRAASITFAQALPLLGDETFRKKKANVWYFDPKKFKMPKKPGA